MRPSRGRRLPAQASQEQGPGVQGSQGSAQRVHWDLAVAPGKPLSYCKPSVTVLSPRKAVGVTLVFVPFRLIVEGQQQRTCTPKWRNRPCSLRLTGRNAFQRPCPCSGSFPSRPSIFPHPHAVSCFNPCSYCGHWRSAQRGWVTYLGTHTRWETLSQAVGCRVPARWVPRGLSWPLPCLPRAWALHPLHSSPQPLPVAWSLGRNPWERCSSRNGAQETAPARDGLMAGGGRARLSRGWAPGQHLGDSEAMTEAREPSSARHTLHAIRK